MTEREELLRRLERVKALAERGVGGEKENAEALLNRLMAKYGISEEDIEDTAERDYFIRYHNFWERKLIVQIAYKHLGSGHCCGTVGTQSGRPHKEICFKLNSTPDSELVEAELRTKTSASEYSIDIYNVGQSPVIIESFDMCWRKQLLIQCFPSSEDATVLPYHNISYVLTQQDADAIERHCKRLGFKQCCIVATTVNGEKIKENIDVSWIHMRTSLWEEA